MSECNCSMRQKLVGDGCHICNPELAKDLSESELVDDLLNFFDRREGEEISTVDVEEVMDKAAARIEELERENASLKNGEDENAELKDKDDLYERDCRIEILSDALRRIRSYQDSDTVSSEEEALAEIFLICEECDV